MVKKYFIFAFEEKEFNDLVKEGNIKTDSTYLMRINWNSELGARLRKEALEKHNLEVNKR